MTNSEIIDIIRYSVPLFKETRPGVYQTRCNFCGDTQKNYREGHMYIFNTDENSAMGYYCHKCNAKGKISPANIDKFTSDYKKISFDGNNISAKLHRARGGNCTGYDYDSSNIDNTSEVYRYLLSRVGCDIPYDAIGRLKIVWDWNKFCNDNNIDDRTYNHFLGRIVFLNSNNCALVGRSLEDNGQWLKQSKDTTYAPYIISVGYDVMNPSPLTVRIAEGIFDIISVYIKYGKNDTDIHMASLGKDYRRVLDYCIQHGIIGSNISVEIYSDKDVPIQELRQQLQKYKPLYQKIVVIYPTTKDFGIPISRIRISNSYEI